MKSREILPSEAALFRLVLAPVAAALIVVIAIVLASPVADSIATLNRSAAELALEMDDGGMWPVDPGIDVQQTRAEPVEPLTTSY